MTNQNRVEQEPATTGSRRAPVSGPRSVPAALAAAVWLFAQPVLAGAQQGWTGEVTTASEPVAPYPGRVSVAADAAGDVVVVWPQAGLIRTARHVRTGGGWSQAVDLGPADPSYVTPGIAIDSDRNATVVWASVRGIQAARYSASAGAWGTAVQVAPAAFPGDPRVGVDERGNVTTVWGDSGRIKVSRYSKPGHPWSVPVDISDGYIPQLGVDHAGNATVLSSRGALNGGGVRAMRYSVDRGTWSGLTDLAALGQLGNAPQIGTDAAGNAIAVWSVYSTGPTFVVQVARFIAATEVWGSVITLGLAGSPLSGGPELAVAPTGDAVVAWTAPGGVVRSSRFDETTETWSAATDVSGSGVGAEVWDVGLDASGRAVALWIEADRRVHAARHPGNSDAWTVPVPISTPGLLSFFPQAAVEVSGSATVVWGAGLPPCPPGCYGAIQSTQWVATPNAPTIASVTTGSGTLAVGFTPPVTVESSFAPTNYAYSIDNGSTWTVRDPASTTPPLVIGGLVDFVPYVLRLLAINSAGSGSASAPVVAIPGLAPGPPTGLAATSVARNTVTLSWTAPASSTAPTGYVLEGGINPGEVLASIPTGSVAPSFTFVAPAGAFYVRMHALTGALRSIASNEIRIFVNVPASPSAPENLLGLANGSGLALSWTNTFGGGAPTSLWLNVTGAVTATLPLPMGDQFTYAGVPPGTYTLSVSAANASGLSPPSNPVTLTFPSPCTGVPAPPTNLQTWKVGSTIYLSWSPPASGTAVASYTVQVSGAYVGSFVTTGRTLSGAAGPGGYVLSVAATNPCGTGAATPTQTVVIP